MKFRLLGPVEVWDGQRRLSLGGERQQRLLALLLLSAGRAVAINELAEMLWDDSPPVTARRQVHNGVWQLRRALGGQAALHSEPPGYRLLVEPDQLDLYRFESALGQARQLAGAGQDAGAAAVLRTALALWRGPALAGLRGTAVEREAARLDEMRLTAIEDCVEWELSAGTPAELTAELAGLVAAHPTRERLAAAYMLALYRTGRHAEAIEVYRRVAAELRDDLGVDPGSLLQRRFTEILRADPALDGPAGTGPAGSGPTGTGPAGTGPGPVDAIDSDPARSPIEQPRAGTQVQVGDVPRRCLPPQVRGYAGRAELVERMVLEAERGNTPADSVIFVISGMAGVGKTALATRVAYRVEQQYPDAHLFVDLQGHSEQGPIDPVDALGVLLSQLGVPSPRVPDDEVGRSSLWRSELARRRAILVLDNAASSAQIEPLLPGQSNTLVLVTSRAALGLLAGARQVSLDVLAPDEAVSLLRQAVGARIDQEPQAAAEVAELCGRLPLALRLAAHRLHDRPKWTVAALAEQLRAADPPSIEVAVEGRSVAAAFAVSYRQLSAPLCRLFRLLGLHPAGTFEAAAAAALAGQPVGQTRVMLDQLVDVNLLNADTPGRYRLHDLLRDFAATLVNADEKPDALLRMFDYYLHTAAAATRYTEQSATRQRLDFGPVGHVRSFTGQADARRWLDAELLTIAALTDLAEQTDQHRHACLLPRAAWHHVYNCGHIALGRRLLQQSLDAAGRLGDESLLASLHGSLGGLYLRMADFVAALDQVDRAIAGFRAIGDRIGEATNLCNAATVYNTLGQFATAAEYARECLAIADALRNQDTVAVAENTLAIALRYLGDYTGALALHRRSLTYLYRTGRSFRVGYLLGELGRDHLSLGHARLALLLFNRTLRIKASSGNEPGWAETLSDIGRALTALGRAAEALPKHRMALDRMRQLGDVNGTAMVANDYATSLAAVGERAEAETLYREALAVSERYGVVYQQARAHAGIATVIEEDMPDLAGEHRRKAQLLWARMGIPAAGVLGDDAGRQRVVR